MQLVSLISTLLNQLLPESFSVQNISSCDERRIRVASLHQFVVSIIRRHGEMRNDTYLLRRYIDPNVAVSYLLIIIRTTTGQVYQ